MKYLSLLSILLGSRCLRSFTDSRHQCTNLILKLTHPWVLREAAFATETVKVLAGKLTAASDLK